MTARPLSSLLQAAARSPLYRPWLPADGIGAEPDDGMIRTGASHQGDPDSGKAQMMQDGHGRDSHLMDPRLAHPQLADLHDRIARAGGTRKQQCFSSENITQADHFASTYRGITSGRSGQRLDYRKSCQWLQQRDAWRRMQLQQRANGDYAVINVASRLFPQDPFDITLVCGILDRSISESLGEIVAHLQRQNRHIFWRGFPARLLENAEQIRNLCQRVGVRRTSVISTGAAATAELQQILSSDTNSGGVVNEYGAQDCGLQLYSCPACGHFHARNPRCLLSVEAGQIYATDLHSHSQPVVAMATGDLAAMHHGACPISTEPGFMPRPIPALQSPDHADALRRRLDAAAQHRPFILTAGQADPILLELRKAAGLQPRDGSAAAGLAAPRQGGVGEIDELVELAGRGAIALCRERLEQRLSPALLSCFARRRTSLISYLIGHLVVMDLPAWRDILAIWLSEARQHGAERATEARLQQSVGLALSRTRGACQNLIGVFDDTSTLLLTLLRDPTPAERLISQTGLDQQVDPLLGRLALLHPEDRPLSLPLISCCSDLLLAHCWRKDRQLLEWLAEACRGSEDGDIRAAEAVHRSGLLRKV